MANLLVVEIEPRSGEWLVGYWYYADNADEPEFVTVSGDEPLDYDLADEVAQNTVRQFPFWYAYFKVPSCQQ